MQTKITEELKPGDYAVSRYGVAGVPLLVLSVKPTPLSPDILAVKVQGKYSTGTLEQHYNWNAKWVVYDSDPNA